MNSFTFLFKAMKETHEQRKTKIDVDEFRSGTTNITHTKNTVYIFIYTNSYVQNRIKNKFTYISLYRYL